MESLEQRRLLSAALDDITFDIVQTSPTSVDLVVQNPHDAHLEIERLSEEGNYYLIGTADDDQPYSMTGMLRDVQYNFRLRCDDSTEVQYIAQSITLTGSDAPSISVSGVSTQGVELTIGYAGQHVDHYEVYASRPGAGWEWVASTNLTETTLMVWSGEPWSYWSDLRYRVQAFNYNVENGEEWYSDYSNIVSASPQAQLAAPTDLQAAVGANGEVTFNWSPSSSPGVAGYELFWTDFVPLSICAFPASQTSVSFGPGECPTYGAFTVQAIGGSYQQFSHYSAPMELGSTGTPPATPTGLRTSVVDKDQVFVQWSEVDKEDEYIVSWKELDSEVELGAISVSQDTTHAIITLPEDYAGKTYQFIVKVRNAAGESNPATTIGSGIALRSVNFSGVFKTPTGEVLPERSSALTVKKDDGSGAYDGPEWLDSNFSGEIDPVTGKKGPYLNGTLFGLNSKGDAEQTHPLSYVRSVPDELAHMTATPQCLYFGDVGINWKIKGSSDEYTFVGEMIDTPFGWIAFNLIAAQALPDTIVSDDLEITWQLSLNGGEDWFEVGTSKNRLYVNGSANANGAFETVLDVGCRGASGKRPANPGEAAAAAKAANREVIDGVAALFSGRNLRRVDGTELFYSHVYDIDPVSGELIERYAFDVEQLMKRMDGYGQCTAWTSFFLAGNAIHGVNGTTLYIKPPAPRPENPPEPMPVKSYTGIKVKPLKAQGTGGSLYGTDEFRLHAVVSMADYDGSIHDPSYECARYDAVIGGATAKAVYEKECFVGWVYTKGGIKLIDPDAPADEDCIWS